LKRDQEGKPRLILFRVSHFVDYHYYQNALGFVLGETSVIKGINEMVKEMGVGQKVQAIIPPELAFGDKGICVESGDCLVKPKSTLVYDIYLVRASPPP